MQTEHPIDLQIAAFMYSKQEERVRLICSHHVWAPHAYLTMCRALGKIQNSGHGRICHARASANCEVHLLRKTGRSHPFPPKRNGVKWFLTLFYYAQLRPQLLRSHLNAALNTSFSWSSNVLQRVEGPPMKRGNGALLLWSKEKCRTLKNVDCFQV